MQAFILMIGLGAPSPLALLVLLESTDSLCELLAPTRLAFRGRRLDVFFFFGIVFR
jgi:hypothetical protein